MKRVSELRFKVALPKVQALLRRKGKKKTTPLGNPSTAEGPITLGINEWLRISECYCLLKGSQGSKITKKRSTRGSPVPSALVLLCL